MSLAKGSTVQIRIAVAIDWRIAIAIGIAILAWLLMR